MVTANLTREKTTFFLPIVQDSTHSTFINIIKLFLAIPGGLKLKFSMAHRWAGYINTKCFTIPTETYMIFMKKKGSYLS